ncbi:MAG: hypothetical protein MJY87_03925 [Fibrobacter sp.]|nr:hypothetical protein [Fibrobacter sp.]
MTVTLESLKKSVGKKNSKSEIFAWLADLERAAGDLDGALQRVNGGLTLYPHDVAAMIVRAKILFQQEKFEECVTQCENILVKDPFSLAGQKIMGDAFDKLGKIHERNLCFRRYHDMDPLNNFWKDEYDVVDMGAAAVAADAAVDLNLTEEDFSMPEMSGSEGVVPENVKTLEELEAENAAAMGENAQELSSGDLFKDDENSSVENSFEKAFGDAFGSLDDEDSTLQDEISGTEITAEPAQEDQGLFEKSSMSSVGISLDDEDGAVSSNPFSSSAFEELSADQQSAPASEFGSLEGLSEESVADDPFAALAAMLPNNDAEEDSMMDNLTEALDATMAEIAGSSTEEKPVEEFPVDENISSTDVNSAMSDFFGLEDDLEPTETADAGSALDNGFGVDDISASVNASSIFGGSSAGEDKPMSVDNAFDDIFGEDELPEELPQTKPAAPVEDKPMSVDNAFDDIFGEDELPEELPQQPAEPVASDDFTFLDESPVEKIETESVFEKSAEAVPQSADEPQTVNSAFDDIFGEDELPEEKPQPAPEETLELPSEESLELPAEDSLELPIEESAFEKSAEDTFELSAEDSVFEKSAEVVPQSADEPQTVNSAFDDIFGEDELPEEKPQPASEETLELPSEESLELPAEDSLELSVEESAFEKSTEDTLELPAEDSLELPAEDAPMAPKDSFGVDTAFDSIFGSEDELPEEKPQPAPEETLELPSEESLELPAEDSLELPVEESAFEMSAEDTLEQPAEDSLELPAENEIADDAVSANTFVSEVETPVAPAISSAMDFVLDDEPATAEPEAPAADNGFSVDNAFDSLFGDDDDLPVEKNEEASAAPAVEDSSTLAEQVDLAESELELPSAVKPESSDLAQEMGGAFASMFGDQDDDLDLPDLNPVASVEDNVTDSALTDEVVTEDAPADKLESDLDKSFSALFGSDDSLNLDENSSSGLFSALDAMSAPAENQENIQEAPAMNGVDSLESEVSGAFKGLFDMDDDSLSLGEDKPSNSGVDFLMSGDSDDEVSAGLINNPDAPLNRGAQDIDDSLNTRTLAEIYFDQGLYGKALEIYSDLAQKEPDNEEIAKRYAEVEKIYREKFGGNG